MLEKIFWFNACRMDLSEEGARRNAVECFGFQLCFSFGLQNVAICNLLCFLTTKMHRKSDTCRNVFHQH